MTEPAFELATPFHLFYYCGVEANTHVEAEESSVDIAKSDPLYRVSLQGIQDLFCGRDRLVFEPERASKHIGRSAGKYCERRGCSCQPVRNLIDRAVATERHDNLVAAHRGTLRQPGRVPSPTCLRHREIVIGRQRILDHHPCARRYSRSRRVHNQHDFH